MITQSIGFIGGGRVTKIILNGWKRANKLPGNIIVTDNNPEVIETLKRDFPAIKIVVNDPSLPAACDVVFIGLHPPVFGEILQKIKTAVKPTTLIVSLAPKISIAKISEGSGGLKNIVRVIPNAPSIVNSGYNPVSFSKDIQSDYKKIVRDLFLPLGELPEVNEDLLEAYALFTGMGPTYLWFQLYELQNIVQSFGLSSEAIQSGLPKMIQGAISTMFDSGLSPSDVMNLIPVKPLGEEEAAIKGFYQTRLNALYNKLKS
jgi:pyrroline-5-carboxylate reductase